jgi:hypothetical protein
VRIDLGGRGLRPAAVKHIIDHYRDFGILWLLQRDNHDPVEEARLVASLGVTDIEVLNEPDYIPMRPNAYAALFRRVRDAVGTRVRLYGAATGKWVDSKRYLEAVLDEGARPDVISFHAYLERSEKTEDMASWASEAKRYGLPVIVSEVGYPTTNRYRERFDGGSSYAGLFIRTKRALDSVPWCWYDGPNPADNGDAGMFDLRPGVGYVPNRNYYDTKAALDRFGH